MFYILAWSCLKRGQRISVLFSPREKWSGQTWHDCLDSWRKSVFCNNSFSHEIAPALTHLLHCASVLSPDWYHLLTNRQTDAQETDSITSTANTRGNNVIGYQYPSSCTKSKWHKLMALEHETTYQLDNSSLSIRSICFLLLQISSHPFVITVGSNYPQIMSQREWNLDKGTARSLPVFQATQRWCLNNEQDSIME